MSFLGSRSRVHVDHVGSCTRSYVISAVGRRWGEERLSRVDRRDVDRTDGHSLLRCRRSVLGSLPSRSRVVGRRSLPSRPRVVGRRSVRSGVIFLEHSICCFKLILGSLNYSYLLRMRFSGSLLCLPNVRGNGPLKPFPALRRVWM